MAGQFSGTSGMKDCDFHFPAGALENGNGVPRRRISAGTPCQTHAPGLWLGFGLSCLHALGAMAGCIWIVLSPNGTRKSERMGCGSRSRRGGGGREAARRGQAVGMPTVTSSVRPLYTGGPLHTEGGAPLVTRRGWLKVAVAAVASLFRRRSKKPVREEVSFPGGAGPGMGSAS